MKPGKPDNIERIEHIISAIDIILSYTERIAFDDFAKDSKTYFATLYQFTIIGEAVANLDSSIMDNYKYPWYKVKSFRNFILHEYHAIDERVVWNTAKIILPEFRKVMVGILENEKNNI